MSKGDWSQDSSIPGNTGGHHDVVSNPASQIADGPIAEAYLTLIATTPLTSQMLLQVLAPPAQAFPRQAEPA